MHDDNWFPLMPWFFCFQDSGIWLLDEEVSDPCRVYGEEIVKTIDAEYGQRVVEDR